MNKSTSKKKRSFLWTIVVPSLFLLLLLAANSYLTLTVFSDLFLRVVQHFGPGKAFGISFLTCGLTLCLIPLFLRVRFKAGSFWGWATGLNLLMMGLFFAFAPSQLIFEQKGALLPAVLLGEHSKPAKSFFSRKLGWGSGEFTTQKTYNPTAGPGDPRKAKWVLTQQDRERIKELEEYFERGADLKEWKKWSSIQYARAWVHMADELKDPKDVFRALSYVSSTHTFRTDEEKRLPYSGKCIEVIQKHLKSKDPRVVEAALESARWIVAGRYADEKTAELMMDIAESHPDPKLRRDAYDSFWVSPLRSERFYKLVHKFLAEGNDPYDYWVGIRVVSIQHKETQPYPRAARDPIVERIWELMDSSKDMEIRLLATTSQANIFKDSRGEDLARVGEKLVPKLRDPQPAMRTRAAWTLAKLDYEPAIHAIIPLLDDKSENCYELINSKLTRYTSRQHRVDDSALKALHDMTKDLGYMKFTYSIREVEKHDPDLAETVTKEAQRAKAWYREHKNNLPKASSS